MIHSYNFQHTERVSGPNVLNEIVSVKKAVYKDQHECEEIKFLFDKEEHIPLNYSVGEEYNIVTDLDLA